MIVVGLPCDFCNSPTVPHCGDGECQWSRCPRCMSYGIPSQNFIQWRREDYLNPYTLTDVKTARPIRKFPAWLEAMYGVQRNTNEPI